ncbi:MAG: hypothetical protein JOY61_20700 [Chloroflexi bacterium]|nr:hypothetical protein [Chloroflexota bacterium]MBV9546794.1 hypothetical protein [Chloroflexota bacterium]
MTSGQARLLLWEGGGSVCDETLAATSADQVIFAARARAQQLIEAYPTRPRSSPDCSVEVARAIAEIRDTVRAGDHRDCRRSAIAVSVE